MAVIPISIFAIGEVIPSSFGTLTVHEIYFRIENDSNSVIALEP